MPNTASRIVSPLVKSLHPIHEIAARVSRGDGNCVRLTRGLAADGDLPELAVVAEVVSQADPTEATIAALDSLGFCTLQQRHLRGSIFGAGGSPTVSEGFWNKLTKYLTY